MKNNVRRPWRPGSGADEVCGHYTSGQAGLSSTAFGPQWATWETRGISSKKPYTLWERAMASRGVGADQGTPVGRSGMATRAWKLPRMRVLKPSRSDTIERLCTLASLGVLGQSQLRPAYMIYHFDLAAARHCRHHFP